MNDKKILKIRKKIGLLYWKHTHAVYTYTNIYESHETQYKALKVMIKTSNKIDKLENKLRKNGVEID